jgi:hypothetical protein
MACPLEQLPPKPPFFFAPVLQIMDGLYQLSQSARPNRIFTLLEVDDCAPGNSRLAREQFIRKLFRFCPDLI